jgi:hypothetical protein
MPEVRYLPEKIGEYIVREDGSYLYMSHKGLLNLDNSVELKQEQDEDSSFLQRSI